MVQRAGRRGSEDRHRGYIGGGVLSWDECAVGHRSPVQRYPSLGDRLVDLAGEFGGLLRGDDGPVGELGQGVVVMYDGQRMAEPHRGHHRQVGGEELIEELALDDIAGIGGAPLLAVFEALAQMRGQQLPLGELPDAPGVEALLLEEVPLARVDQSGRDLAAGGASTDEGQSTDLRRPHQCTRQPGAGPRDQGHRQALAPRQGAGEGEAGGTAVGRGLRDCRVASQNLDQHRVHEHAHRVVPAGDVADRPW